MFPYHLPHLSLYLYQLPCPFLLYQLPCPFLRFIFHSLLLFHFCFPLLLYCVLLLPFFLVFHLPPTTLLCHTSFLLSDLMFFSSFFTLILFYSQFFNVEVPLLLYRITPLQFFLYYIPPNTLLKPVFFFFLFMNPQVPFFLFHTYTVLVSVFFHFCIPFPYRVLLLPFFVILHPPNAPTSLLLQMFLL